MTAAAELRKMAERLRQELVRRDLSREASAFNYALGRAADLLERRARKLDKERKTK